MSWETVVLIGMGLMFIISILAYFAVRRIANKITEELS